jgi:2-octaprenyl-6-methoxyphenol hydroxylase
MNHVDIAIAGRGVMGLVLALVATRQGKRIILLGQPPEEEKMARMIALSYDSAEFLSELGIFSRIHNVTPIREVKIMDGKHTVSLHAHELQLPALGYTCTYRDIYAACQGVMMTPSSDHLPLKIFGTRAYLAMFNQETITTKLLAITTPVALPKSHYQPLRQATIITAFAEHTPLEQAFEIFTEKGPVALLPCANGIFIVASLQEQDAILLENASESGQAQFLQALVAPAQVQLQQPKFLQRLSFTARYCKEKPRERRIVLGDAWHTLHPIGAQGLNLGLRDIRAFQSVLDSFADPGDEKAIQTFYRLREDDVLLTLGLTQTLYFLSTGPFLARFAQRMVIDALSSFSPLRRFFFEHTVYGWSEI